jgi:glycyl-tRNA synthetase beta subunit
MNLSEESNELSKLVNTTIDKAEKVVELRTLTTIINYINKKFAEIEVSEDTDEVKLIKCTILFETNQFILSIAQAKHLNLN